MRYALLCSFLLWLSPSAHGAAPGSALPTSTCTDGGPFHFEVGVFLPPGSPQVHLRVSTVDTDSTLWEGDLKTSQTVTGPSGCHWAAHVGEPAPPDPLRAELPAHRLLRFDFGPPAATPYALGSFEYLFCRAPSGSQSAPAGSFHCPQDPTTLDDGETHLVFVYSPNLKDLYEGMAVVVPSVMEDGSGTFDDLVEDIYWVLPYDLEQACGRSCDTAPDDPAIGCDAEAAERETPFLRRIVGTSFPGITPNPGALWIIRPGRTVVWDVADIYPQGVMAAIGFQGGACVGVGGTLEVKGLGLTANEAFFPWRGVYVLEDGLLKLKEGTSVSYVGGLLFPVVPGAILTYGGRIVLDDAVLTDNFTRGLYVSGEGGRATVGGESLIRNSYIPSNATYKLPGVEVAAGASALIMENSRIEENTGAGVRATGYGTSVNLHEAVIENNNGAGVEALDAAEVFFARTDTGDPNPVAESFVRFNDEGSISAEGGAGLIAGISDGTRCRRFCNNTIEREVPGGAYDARSVLGGVNYAEANFWGFHVQDVSDLVLVEDPASFLSVEPILTEPPSLTGGGGAAARATGGGAVHRGDDPTDVRALVGEARALEAEGDSAGAFAAISASLLAARTEDERRQAYTSAGAMMAHMQPLPLVAWLTVQAGVGGPERPWALRALAVAHAASGAPEVALEAAQALVAGYSGSEHALAGLGLPVRLAVKARDEEGALAALDALVAAFPDSTETARAATLVLAAFPWVEVGEALAAGPTGERQPAAEAEPAVLAAEDAALAVTPNPTSRDALVTLVLDETARVRLEVLDVLGRRVAVLHDGVLAAGRHTLRLDGTRLPAGLYLVRAVVTPERGAERVLVRRLTLTR